MDGRYRVKGKQDGGIDRYMYNESLHVNYFVG